jgi:hypothetical protein
MVDPIGANGNTTDILGRVTAALTRAKRWGAMRNKASPNTRSLSFERFCLIQCNLEVAGAGPAPRTSGLSASSCLGTKGKRGQLQ